MRLHLPNRTTKGFVALLMLTVALVYCLNAPRLRTQVRQVTPLEIQYSHETSVGPLQQTSTLSDEAETAPIGGSLQPVHKRSMEYRVLTLAEMGITDEEARFALKDTLVREVHGRRIPEVASLDEIHSGAWRGKIVPSRFEIHIATCCL